MINEEVPQKSEVYIEARVRIMLEVVGDDADSEDVNRLLNSGALAFTSPVEGTTVLSVDVKDWEFI